MNWKEQAREKLEKELKAGSYDRYANVMKNSVKEALESFADQDDEFAQAIVQGGSFSDCMKAVAKGCGQSISDLEAYQRAAAFYFPGAKIKFQMRIDLIGDAAGADDAGEEKENGGAVIIDLLQFL